eukprot:scaffold983_cov82-Cylindrotheca_fusiformis.AAC.2
MEGVIDGKGSMIINLAATVAAVATVTVTQGTVVIRGGGFMNAMDHQAVTAVTKGRQVMVKTIGTTAFEDFSMKDEMISMQ